MNEFFRRLRYLRNKRRFDQELANDMEFHCEMAARDANGHSMERRFGNALRLREEARDAWGWTWIDRIWQDIRYGARMLRKSPGFTLAAITMLAVGIGANVAAFGFFNLMVLRPIAVRDPATLVRFQRRSPQSYASNLPYPEMEFFAEHSRTLSAVLALNDSKLAIDGEEKPINAKFVTANLFSELGATAKLGRVLDPVRDAGKGVEPVVVLSEGFWERHFGADPLIVGKRIRLNDKPVVVAGVAAAEFSGLSMDNLDVWLPLQQQPYFISGSQLLTDFSAEGSGVKMFGRLQPGVAPKAAEAELRALAAELHHEHPNEIWKDESLPSEPGGYAKNIMGARHGTGTDHSNEFYPTMALVSTLVLLILAVACANLGSLLLARGMARAREIAIRVAVGAGRGRLIRQLFTESLLLAAFGSIAGLALGYFVLRGLMILTAVPAWLNPAPDWRVMVFAIGTGFAASIIFGLTPALQVVRQRQRATVMRQILVGTQVMASCVLLIVAGLLVRALNGALSTSPGFDYQRIVSIDPGLSAHGYAPERSRAYLEALEARLRNIPGVQSLSLTSAPPLGNKKISVGVEENGRVIDIHLNIIDPQFFQTMNIPLLGGRNFTRVDTHEIIVSQSLAHLVWPAENPLGKTLQIGDVTYSVIGISGNARIVMIQDSDDVEMYQLADAGDLPSMVVLVRTSGPPEGSVGLMASVARTVDGNVIPEVQLLKTSFRSKVQGAQYSAMTVSLLGLVALLLACLGIVGLVAYAVSQRTKEIGIRMALGAPPSHVISVVLRQFAVPNFIGLLVGIAGAAALSKFLRGQLYGVSNLDPMAYALAVGIFVLAAAVAALLPAKRALRVDPLTTLRYE